MSIVVKTVTIVPPSVRADGTPLALEDISMLEVYAGNDQSAPGGVVYQGPLILVKDINVDDSKTTYVVARVRDDTGQIGDFSTQVVIDPAPALAVPAAPSLSV